MRPLTLKDFTDTGWNVGNPSILAQVNGILASQDEVFTKYGIVTDFHVAMLMGQLSHESGRGTEMVEILNYRAEKLLTQWKTHFTREQAYKYGRTSDHGADQKMIGILAYGGRMGNAPNPSEDGWNYRGRGFIQTTGKNGYADLAKLTGLDVLANPDLVNDPEHAFACAVAEFVNYPGMLGFASKGDIRAVSGLINRGTAKASIQSIVGYSNRVVETAQWKRQFQV